jgi:outer membrane protein OmpA-like peptidoglycan-associated protein
MNKMKNLNLIVATIIALSIFSGCALKKMVKLAEKQDLEVSPNPLELHGNQVAFDLSAVLPPKMLPTGKVYTLNTTYQYGDEEIEVGSIEFNAENYPQSSSTTSRVSRSFSMPFNASLNPGSLIIQGEAKDPKNGKALTTAKMEIAVGIITTSRAVQNDYATNYADHGYNDQEELIPTNINFYFPQGSSYLSQYLATDGKSNKAKKSNLSAFIADKNVTRTVTITGTHSPEGSETINGDLSKNRAESIEKYYRSQMRKYDYTGTAAEIKFILKPVVQDWTAFKVAMRASEISEDSKKSFLNIVNGSGSFEDKEKAMRKIPAYKSVFDKVYPSLRTAQTEILTVKEKKSPAEISLLAKHIVNGDTTSEVLSNEELLYAATLTPSLKEKEEIYIAASKKEGSWVAHNNLAAVYLQMAEQIGDDMAKNIQDALTQLDIASNKTDHIEVHANRGTALMMQASYQESFEALSLAMSGATGDLKEALNASIGSIHIRMGDYEKASAALAAADDNEVTNFNRGLAHLLGDNLDGANREFNKISKSSSLSSHAAYYLAVTAARSNNESGIKSKLKAAVSIDVTLKEKALNDLEFSNYADAVAEAIR